MAILTMKEINSVYSNIVTDLISKGYQIEPTTMNGSYSNEICHIDLSPKNKSNELIRVWMVKLLEKDSKVFVREAIKITVRKYDKRSHICWYENGEVVGEEFTYYEISYLAAYTNDVNDIIGIQNIRRDRRTARAKLNAPKEIDLNKCSYSLKNSILNRIKTFRGAKRANSFDCIKSITTVKSNSNNRFCAKVVWQYKEHSGNFNIGNIF